MSWTLTFADHKSDLRLVLQLTHLSQKHGGRTFKATSNGYLKAYRSVKPSVKTGGGCTTMQIAFLVMRLSKMGNEDRFSGVCGVTATLSKGGAPAQVWDFWMHLEAGPGPVTRPGGDMWVRTDRL
mgnify:FL=1